jgi:hypothetical protein
MHTQGCLQLAEEVDKEHRKMTDKIAERCEVVKVRNPNPDPVTWVSCSSWLHSIL